MVAVTVAAGALPSSLPPVAEAEEPPLPPHALAPTSTAPVSSAIPTLVLARLIHVLRSITTSSDAPAALTYIGTSARLRSVAALM
jgi:hypothetical protein